ncbi:hypothetical protein ES708_27560 [subsurface metagenome]
MVEILETMLRISVVFCSVPLVPQIPLDSNYIDPGTGSLIIQIVIGSLIGGFFLLKVFWGKVSAFFGRLFSSIKKRNP